jgi:hypothetical protein
MKKFITLIFAVLIVALACKSTPVVPEGENPGKGPEITVVIPELFSPDPDNADSKMTISIAVDHPADIKDWNIQINRSPRSDEQVQRTGTGTRRNRMFFEQSGTGAVPSSWEWNGRGVNDELVQSATDYRFALSVNDVFGNNTLYEGTISTDVIIRTEGDKLRIIVPSIIFPANESDLSLVADEDDRRRNTRVLFLIARALNRFDGYNITVEGHANPTQRPNSAARNNENPILRRLSLQRAQAVIDHLVTNNNINRARLTAVGIGGDRTIVAWDNAEENWKNRRVEFILER